MFALLSPLLALLPLVTPTRVVPIQDDEWPRPVFLDLELDLASPPRIVERARVTFEGVKQRELRFLLNTSLAVVALQDDAGRALSCVPQFSLRRNRYHGEGRTWVVDLGRDPDPDGERITLDLSIEGVGDDGTAERDWRGILLLAPDEMRMSEQTIFYPQVPLSSSGPGKVGTEARVEVLAPADLEVFVAGRPATARAQPRAGARAWAFEVEQAGTLDVVAGRYARSQREVDGMSLVALLFPEHADRAEAWLAEAARAAAFYGARFGPSRANALAVVEMRSRKDSYNWASRGLLVFDRAVFSGDVRVDTLAHEVAHLWWGQTVHAAGEGERFLTEGLAEYSSWRYVEEVQGADAARGLARAARERYLAAVHAEKADPALARVDFTTPGYSALAYAKGALVLRAVEAELGRESMDFGLARYAERFGGDAAVRRGRTAGLEDLGEALFGEEGASWARAPWVRADGHVHVTPDGERGFAWRIVDCPERLPRLVPTAIEWAGSPQGAGRLTPTGGRLEVTPLVALDAVTLDPAVTQPVAGETTIVRGGARVVSADPADGAVGVDYLRGALTVEFDRPLGPVDARRLLAAIRSASSEERRAPVVQLPLVKEGTLTLVLKGPLEPGQDYGLVLRDLVDASGAPVPPVTVRFATAPPVETERPRVVSTDPPSGATVPRDLGQLRIRFSEPMRAGRGYSSTLIRELERDRGVRFPIDLLGDSRWDAGGTELVYDLKGPLEPGVQYLMPLRGSFRDVHGNTLVDFDLAFRAE